MHAATRKFIASAVSPAVAEAVRIIYGGSVNAKNSKELGASDSRAYSPMKLTGARLCAPCR